MLGKIGLGNAKVGSYTVAESTVTVQQTTSSPGSTRIGQWQIIKIWEI